MLVTTNPQRTLWETLLPPGYEELPAALAAADALLGDPVFFAPYRAHFSPIWGRPSIPIETYLLMMSLKHRYRLGYESLCLRAVVLLASTGRQQPLRPASQSAAVRSAVTELATRRCSKDRR